LFGQGYHALLNGTFDKEFAVLDETQRPEPDKTMASNLNKAWKATIEAQGLPIIAADQYADMCAMRDMMQANEYVKRMNAFTYVQEEVYSATVDGYNLKCKPDCIIAERSLLVDWKTTAELPVNEYQAERAIRKYNYHFQAALYCDVTGMDHFIFFFQEKSAPFDVVPVLIRKGSPLMEEGRELWRYCAKLATECKKTGIYPGISGQLTDKCITL
jgi:hypothetical protein